MKPLHNYLRTGAVIAGLLGAAAVPAVAASPALAVNAYGSGAAAQKTLQSTWITDSGDSVNYNPTTSLGGQKEFGVDTLTLDPTQDSVANAAGALDAYVGVDSPITSTEQGNAGTAAGVSSTGLLSIPVAQASLVIELNVPSGITLNSGQNINLTNKLAEQLFAGTVPKSTDYSANTWGALLEDSGLALVINPPTVGQFEDSGTKGGATAISLVLRNDGAGTTLTLKQYLNNINSTDFPTGKIDENTQATGEWPTTATIASRQSSDGNQANAVSANAGTAGWGTLAAALGATPSAFAETPGSGGTHTLIASLQDNGTSPTSPRFAAPENTTTGASNVYTGTKINTGSGGVGNWLVPLIKGSLNTTGVWGKDVTEPADYSRNWDPDVYDDSGKEGDFYPLAIVFWDLSWDHPVWGTGSLTSPLYSPVATVESTAKSYLQYATSSTGQAETVSPHYAPLPTAIAADANTIAGAI
jgi:hypothetical protein